jgi:hypothetical protein|tara:strand:- start:322 stop:501 length:180 start_codon:yes stop_codon:yes gene_type:complete
LKQRVTIGFINLIPSKCTGNVFFMDMIIIDSEKKLAVNIGEGYLVANNGNEKLEEQILN